MNHWTGSGRLTKEPELRYTASGKAVLQVTLAVDRRPTADGKKATDFLPCVAWEGLARTIAEYCGKGSKIMVEGRVQVRSYEGKDKQLHYVTEIVLTGMEFCDKKNAPAERERAEPQSQDLFGATDVRAEDIPF